MSPELRNSHRPRAENEVTRFAGRTTGVLVRIMARERSDAHLSEPEKCFLNPKIAIELSERPTAVGG